MSTTTTIQNLPLLLADCTRGIYAMHHAARTMHTATTNGSGWKCSDMDSLAYAAADVEQAVETAVELERATYTDAQGMTWRLEQVEGGDVFLFPNA